MYINFLKAVAKKASSCVTSCISPQGFWSRNWITEFLLFSFPGVQSPLRTRRISTKQWSGWVWQFHQISMELTNVLFPISCQFSGLLWIPLWDSPSHNSEKFSVGEKQDDRPSIADNWRRWEDLGIFGVISRSFIIEIVTPQEHRSFQVNQLCSCSAQNRRKVNPNSVYYKTPEDRKCDSWGSR